MTKYKIAKVDVHITSVIFPAPKAQPPAEPAPADQAANALSKIGNAAFPLACEGEQLHEDKEI